MSSSATPTTRPCTSPRAPASTRSGLTSRGFHNSMRQKKVVEPKGRSELPRAEQSAPRAGGSAFAVFPGSWTSNLRGDLTGGVIAAVLTIPMSIGFGLLAFAPFGERFLSIGILTGLYGAIFLGVVALLLGARTVTIYAPRSLIAFMIGSIAMQGFAKPPAGPLGQLEPYYLAGALLATLSLAGLIQMIFGAVRLGALVRFIPSPVMAGFQNAAALLILYSQLHIMLGLPHRLPRSEEHTSELQSHSDLVCRLLLGKK